MAKKDKKKSSFRGKVAGDSQRQKNSKTTFGYLNLPKGMALYTPTPGAKETFDILPYRVTMTNHPDFDKETGVAEVDSLWYKRPFKTHRGVGSDNDTVVCLQSFGKKCPICEYRKKRASEKADKDELKAFNTSNRNLYVVIPKGIKKVEEIPHIFDFSQFNFQDLLNEEIEENEDYEVFPDLEEGLTLKVRWEKETFAGNSYAAAGRIDFMERDEAYDESILDDVPDLDSILKQISYEALEAKFFEIDHESDSDEDDEDTDKKKKTVSKTKKKEENPFDEDEDEDEKPKKPSHKSSTKSAQASKNIDEDEDDEETDEEPIKKPAKAKKETKKEVEVIWTDLVDMDMTELNEVIESKGLDIDSEDYDTEEEVAKAIAEELNIEIPKKAAKKEEKKVESKQPDKKQASGNKCPSGLKYGVDTDTDDACDDCPLWDACSETKDKKGK